MKKTIVLIIGLFLILALALTLGRRRQHGYRASHRWGG